MSDRFITIPHFGERIDASPKRAKRVVESAGLPTYQIGGRRQLRESDVTAYLEGQRIEPTVSEINLKTLVHQAVERAKKRRRS